jgi:hypothetical protein
MRGFPSTKPCKSCNCIINEDNIVWDNYGTRSGYCKACYRLRKVGHRKKYRESNPDSVRNTWFKCVYKISLEDYNKLVESQNNLCAICGGTNSRALEIDHNHETNEIRGLLCFNCNTALGLLREDKNILMNMIDYLLKHNKEEFEFQHE